MADLPTGTVTLLFTDLEGSTGPQQAHPAAYAEAVRRHHALLRGAVEAHGGVVFETVGDAVYAAFARPTDAVAAALAGQLALRREAWDATGPLRARMGLHLGEVEVYPAPGAAQGARYLGLPLVRCARLMATAHGGQTVLSEAVTVLARDALPPGAALRDLGPHRLKDLQRPERVAQLLHAELPAAFPPLRSLDAVPHHLPRQGTPFIGREAELAAVTARVRDPDVPLLTLTGPGGTGKTRLALQAAAEALDPAGPDADAAGARFPDGAWFVDLAPLTDAALVPDAVAQALGVREGAGRPVGEALRDHLRDKRALLVLDNCEHLLPGVAAEAAALLAAGPGVTLLATSREPLRVAAEREHPVPPLALPPLPGPPGVPGAVPPPDPAALSQYEAVALFIERATAARPDFAVTNATAPAVAELCHRLDGLPLALELAAARVRVLPPPALLARLGDRLGVLTGGRRDAPARQQTLRATLDWSHDLLAPAERALFARLAVFAGGFPLEGAETVCAGGAVGPSDVLDLVTGLVDKSLVVAEPHGPDPRYRLLETVRQYAAEQLRQAGEEAAVRDRHLGWCVALAHGASETERSRDPARFHEAFGRYNAESDNLRAALAWGATTPDGASRALDVVAGVIMAPRPSQAETVRWLETLLAAAPARTRSRARALLQLDFYRRINHDFAGARVVVEEARAIAEEIGDEALTTHAAESGALVAANLGEYAVAVAELERCLAVARGRGSWTWVEGFTRDLGGIFLATGDFPRARAALAESRDVGLAHDSNGTLRPRLFLTVVDRLTGDLRGARAALAALGTEADAWDAAGRQLFRFNFREPARWALANLARDEGRLDEARRLLAQSLEDLRRLGEVGQLFAPTCMAGLLDIAAGDAARGVALLAACSPPAGPIGTVHVPELRVEAPAFLERARAALGDAAYGAAWARGRRLTLQGAVELALAETTAVPAPRRPAPGALSPREAQVAALVAGGLTNREIAAALLVTEHTAERHVEHILSKLGLRSRTQVAAWAVAHGVAAGPAPIQGEDVGPA